MQIFLLVASLLAFAHGQGITFAYQGNVSLTNSNDFVFRSTSMIDFSVLSLYTGIFTTSINVDFGSNTASADGIYGAAYAGVSAPPTAYLSYWATNSQWQNSNNGITDYGSANITASAAFIGKVFLSLDEVTPNNVTVQTISLVFSLAKPTSSVTWTLGNSQYGSSLRYATLVGSIVGNSNFKIYLSYLISDVVGVINAPGSAIVTPKSLESVIEIDNFPYQSTANSVRLNLVVGSAAGTVSAQGSVTHFINGNNGNTAYVTLDHSHSADGVITPVSITGWIAGSASAGTGVGNFDAQVRGKYAATASFTFVSVTFKAGAAKIIYDPTIGVGSNPPSSAGVKVAPFLAIFIALIKIFLF
jgi:hypothetical protein